MNQRVIATIGALLIGTAIISGCGSEKQPEDTSLKVRTITIGEESGTTSAGYAGTIHNKTETKLAFQIGGRVINKFVNVGDVVQAGQVMPWWSTARWRCRAPFRATGQPPPQWVPRQ